MTAMEDAHAKDYARRREMQEARQAILKFLEANGESLHRFTKLALEHAALQLWEDMLRVDQRWD